MKYYYLVAASGGAEKIYYILQGDVENIATKSEYVQPSNVKLFWYKNEKVKNSVLKHIESWQHVGWEKYRLGGGRRDLIERIFKAIK